MCSQCFTQAKSKGKKAIVHNLTNDAITSRNDIDVSTDDSETTPWKVTAKIHEAIKALCLNYFFCSKPISLNSA